MPFELSLAAHENRWICVRFFFAPESFLNYKTSPHIKHNLRFRDFYLLIKCHISFTVFMFVQIPRNNNLIVEI